MQVDTVLGNSRWAVVVGCGGAVLSSAALWISHLPWWLCIGVQMILCALAWWRWRMRWLVTALYHEKGLRWQCLVADQWHGVQMRRVYVVAGVWMAEVHVGGSKQPAKQLIHIWRDQVDDQTWRQLRVYALLHRHHGQTVG